jgi:CP family cyanate transporter-like MFS transporter
VLLPAVVKRDFADHPGTATGVYTMVLGGSAALSAGVTVPIGRAIGHGWRGSLGFWAIPAAVAFLVWLPRLRGHTLPPRTESSGVLRDLFRDRLAWALSLYMGIQSAVFYATTAWLPTLYQSHGYSKTDAGLILSVLTFVGLPTGILVPTLAARRVDQRIWAAATSAWTTLGFVGLVFWPTTVPYLWAAIVGTGLGATFPLVLTLVVLRARTSEDTGGLSAMVQGVGYGIAALGPLVVGALHDATGSWRVAFLLLLALTVPQLVVGVLSGRARYVRSASTAPLRGA